MTPVEPFWTGRVTPEGPECHYYRLGPGVWARVRVGSEQVEVLGPGGWWPAPAVRTVRPA